MSLTALCVVDPHNTFVDWRGEPEFLKLELWRRTGKVVSVLGGWRGYLARASAT